jgi:hypothetical protein
MQKSDRHQDPAVASALISFLASTGQDPGLLGKTLRRLYNDKSLAVTHTECNAVSAYLQRQLSPDRRILQLSRNTSAVNYLAAYPYTINRVSRLPDSCAPTVCALSARPFFCGYTLVVAIV